MTDTIHTKCFGKPLVMVAFQLRVRVTQFTFKERILLAEVELESATQEFAFPVCIGEEVSEDPPTL